MRIGELARATGSTPRQIRHYDAAGLLSSSRESNGYREFGEEDVQRVRDIRCLIDCGLTISEIAGELLAAFDRDALDGLDEPGREAALARVNARIHTLETIDTRTHYQLNQLRALQTKFTRV